jgi:hypothetical protein
LRKVYQDPKPCNIAANIVEGHNSLLPGGCGRNLCARTGDVSWHTANYASRTFVVNRIREDARSLYMTANKCGNYWGLLYRLEVTERSDRDNASYENCKLVGEMPSEQASGLPHMSSKKTRNKTANKEGPRYLFCTLYIQGTHRREMSSRAAALSEIRES